MVQGTGNRVGRSRRDRQLMNHESWLPRPVGMPLPWAILSHHIAPSPFSLFKKSRPFASIRVHSRFKNSSLFPPKPPPEAPLRCSMFDVGRSMFLFLTIIKPAPSPRARFFPPRTSRRLPDHGPPASRSKTLPKCRKISPASAPSPH